MSNILFLFFAKINTAMCIESHFPMGGTGLSKLLARRASRCPVDAQFWEKMMQNAPKL